MLMISIFLFTISAFLGFYLLTYILQNKNTPKGVAFTHGPLAVMGLILLIIYALYQPAPIVSIIVFILAMMGGFLLIFRDITGQPIPKWLAIGHGLLAVVGYIFLLIFAFYK